MTQDLRVPVLTLDGGVGSGKSTVGNEVAKRLEFHRLDSGVLYRVLGWLWRNEGMNNLPAVVSQFSHLAHRLTLDGERIMVNGQDRTVEIRSEEVGKLASSVAAISEVREALRPIQLGMRQAPGLVPDGRDMAFIFNTPFRYFLAVSLEVATQRRLTQLKALGKPANYKAVLAWIKARNRKDCERSVAPLRPHPEAIQIDTSDKTIEHITHFILSDFRGRWLGGN